MVRRRSARKLGATLALLGFASAFAVSSTAHAQDSGSVPTSTIGGAGPDPGLQLAQKRPYWSAGPERAFVSATFEVGVVYYRPQLAIGWGKPHWKWVGVETQALVGAASSSQYGGLRLEVPFGELRTGVRYGVDWGQSYLLRRPTYDDEMIEEDTEPRSRHLTLEAETAGWLPIGGGALVGSATLMHMLGVPEAYDLYFPYLNVVVEPPWIARTRGGYLHGFGDDRGLVVGAAVELIAIPERDAYIVRAGPQIGIAVTHHLDAALSIMAVASSPDSLRLEGAEIGQLGFRYRWATGDRFPEFP